MEKYDIFVCCGGKCGGTTLANTFHENGYKTVHVHSSKHLGNFKSDIDLANGNLYKVIDYSKEKNKIYIIDSYRTPIERKISCFFQKIHIYIPNYKNVTIENLIDYFNEHILDSSVGTNHSINEFITYYEANPITKFNYKKKYVKREKNNIIFIKLLFSDIKEWGNILSDAFEKEIVIHNANLTSDKSISEIYSQFKEKYLLPKYFIEKIKVDKELAIYMQPYQVTKYIEYWTEKSI